MPTREGASFPSLVILRCAFKPRPFCSFLVCPPPPPSPASGRPRFSQALQTPRFRCLPAPLRRSHLGSAAATATGLPALPPAAGAQAPGGPSPAARAQEVLRVCGRPRFASCSSSAPNPLETVTREARTSGSSVSETQCGPASSLASRPSEALAAPLEFFKRGASLSRVICDFMPSPFSSPRFAATLKGTNANKKQVFFPPLLTKLRGPLGRRHRTSEFR